METLGDKECKKGKKKKKKKKRAAAIYCRRFVVPIERLWVD
jgi:hypothetical protein